MGTSIYITALDGIVNVNSLFTFAVFIGLAWNPSDPNTRLIDDSKCIPGFKVTENLISFHIYSFSCFLFSTLIAQCLKQAIKIAKNTNSQDSMKARVNTTMLRLGMLASAIGSVFGCVFLMLALISVIQIKLGNFSCPTSKYGIAAVVPLVILVPAALLIYVCIIVYAFTC